MHVWESTRIIGDTLDEKEGADQGCQDDTDVILAVATEDHESNGTDSHHGDVDAIRVDHGSDGDQMTAQDTSDDGEDDDAPLLHLVHAVTDG